MSNSKKAVAGNAEQLEAVRAGILEIESRLGAAYDAEQSGNGNGDSVRIFEELTEARRQEQCLTAQIEWRKSEAGRAEAIAKIQALELKKKALEDDLDSLDEVGAKLDALFDRLSALSVNISDALTAAGAHGDPEIQHKVIKARQIFKSYVLHRIAPMIGKDAFLGRAFDTKKFSNFLPTKG